MKFGYMYIVLEIHTRGAEYAFATPIYCSMTQTARRKLEVWRVWLQLLTQGQSKSLGALRWSGCEVGLCERVDDDRLASRGRGVKSKAKK